MQRFRRGHFCLLASLLFSVAAHAQDAGGTQPITTLKASTRLVVVDVTVTDKKGRPVRGLKPGDFTLNENGQPQTLRQVDEHTPATANAIVALPKLPAGTFTNLAATPKTGALNILLLDSLNTPLEDQPFVRQEIQKYLKNPQTTAPMAIFGLSQQLHLLQGFTSNPEVLQAAVAGKKAMPELSAVARDRLEDNQDAAAQLSMAADSGPGQAEFILANYNQFMAERASYNLSLRIRVTLESLNALAHYLSGQPGRKNLIWFSGAFPLNVLPNGDLKYPFAAAVDMADEFRATSDLLAHSQVSVYPIDARGVQGMADPNDPTFNNPTTLAAGLGGNSAQETHLEQSTGAQSTMLLMAENTGGKAYINTNDLRQAVGKAIDAGSSYYTLSYTPANKDWTGDFRKLEVKLAGSGYTLSYRRGYYADDPDAPLPAKTAADRPVTRLDPMRTAMLFGGPSPEEIVFSTTVRPLTGKPEAETAQGNRTDGKTQGPWITYDVIFKADAGALTAEKTAAGRHVDVGFVTYVYDDKGHVVNSAGSRVAVDVPEEKWKQMLAEGVGYRQQVSVPAKGEYFLRFGVNDAASNHVGALEVPVRVVSGLKPAE